MLHWAGMKLKVIGNAKSFTMILTQYVAGVGSQVAFHGGLATRELRLRPSKHIQSCTVEGKISS